MRSAWRCTGRARPTASRIWKGRFLAELRELVGREIPIVVSLDLHGNTTQAMLEHATAAFYCHEYPHVDTYDRGVEIVETAAKILRGEITPVMHLRRLPLIIPPSTTLSGPAKAINERCFEWERRAGRDRLQLHPRLPAHRRLRDRDVGARHHRRRSRSGETGGGRRRGARSSPRWRISGRRCPGAEEAIAQALAATDLPVIVAEVSDNPGGGAPGSGTHLLRALLAPNEPAPASASSGTRRRRSRRTRPARARRSTVKLGGFTDELHGAPIEATAYVKCLTDGRFMLVNPMGAGSEVNLGKMARLVIGNVDVIVGSSRAQTLDAQLFLLHGIDVRDYRVVALKSQQHFRGGFQDLAGTIIRCDTPGFTTSNLCNLPFQRIRARSGRSIRCRPRTPRHRGAERIRIREAGVPSLTCQLGAM